MNYKFFLSIVLLSGGLLGSAQAVDAQLSAFGTIGGTISDKGYNYQRFINDEGTLKRDSVFGVQTDIAFDDHWSATLQGKIAPKDDSDSGWEPSVSWAFLSYRPTNDWLIRAGKVRAPLYLNSQNMSVGVTYDVARLPYEVYSVSPSDDGIGVIVTKSFEDDDGEIMVDAFYGVIKASYRVFMRDDLSSLSAYGGMPKGASFLDLDITSTGLSITKETDAGNRFRAGVYKSKVKYQNGLGLAGNFVLQNPNPMLQLITGNPLFPYYQPDGALDKNDVLAFTVGMDYGFGNGYRVVSELAIRNMVNADTGPNAQSGYITIMKKIDQWTPYATIAGIRTKDNVKNLYNNLNSDPINQVLPINRQFADYAVATEEKSYTIGTSYTITPLQKIKAEWMHVNIGSVSNFLIDSPGDQAITNTSLNIYTLSYSVAF